MLWALAALALVTVAFCRFFHGTYFSEDDFVWMCFCKYYPEPLTVLWRDTLCRQFFRPVGELWYGALHAVAGNQVRAYQVAFLLVHLLNGGLAAWLTGRLINPAVGCCVWLLFTLNDLFVACISIHYFFIFDTLGFSSFLVALLCLSSAQSKRPACYGTISLLAALASYLTKEAYFTLPGAAVLVLGVEPGSVWRWSVLRRRWHWLALHGLVWAAALGWRTAVIRGFGGYGIASIANGHDLAHQLTERAVTWFGFAGRSLLPALSPAKPEDLWVLPASVCVLAAVTAAATFDRRNRPWVLWSWCWAVVTWGPSLLMVTCAPVSWYAPSLGMAVLGALSCYRWKGAQVVGLFFGLYLSIHAWSVYVSREPSMAMLKSQQKELERLFPAGGSREPPRTCYVLFDVSPELFADAVVKYHTPPGAAMADVFFFNAKSPNLWVLTNGSEPADLYPVAPSAKFPQPYVDLGPYRLYVLGRDERAVEGRRLAKREFRHLQWDGGSLVDVTAKLRRAQRRGDPVP